MVNQQKFLYKTGIKIKYKKIKKMKSFIIELKTYVYKKQKINENSNKLS